MTLSDPANPTLEGWLRIESVGPEGSDLAVQGSYAYAILNNEFCVIDIRDPVNPTIVARSLLSVGGSSQFPPHILVTGTRAYIGAVATIALLDISNPSAPKLMKTYGTKAVNYGYGGGGGISAIRLVGTRLYAALGYDGLQIIDVSPPSNFSSIGIYYTYTNIRQVFFSDNYAFLLNYPVGIQAIDLSDPANPNLVGTYPYTFSARFYPSPTFKIRGAYQYFCDQNAGMSVVDFTTPSAPVVTSQPLADEMASPTNQVRMSLSIAGNTAYLWTSQNEPPGGFDYQTNILRAFDLSNPANPTNVWNIPAQRFEGLAITSPLPLFWVEKDLLYSFDSNYSGNNNLNLFDLTTPAN